MEHPHTRNKNKPKISLVKFKDAHSMWEYAYEYAYAEFGSAIKDDWNNILEKSQRDLDVHSFLREYLWCVYVSGFTARRVAEMLPKLLIAHNIEDVGGKFISPTYKNIVKDYSVFDNINKNKQKIKAIQATRKLIVDRGWVDFEKTYLKDRSPENIQKLSMMGPATSCHLARNLGNINVVKPDVHLQRVATNYGFSSVLALCKAISPEPPGLVDLILWYAAIDNGTR